MKRQFFLFLIFGILVLSYGNITIANFELPKTEINIILHNDYSFSKLKNNHNFCKKNKFKCCLLPSKYFLKNILMDLSGKNKKIKNIYIYNCLSCLEKIRNYIYIKKIPINYYLQNFYSKENLYIGLTGIIKSNC